MGAVSIWRCCRSSICTPMLKIRRSHDCLIFNTEIAKHEKDAICIEIGPWSQSPIDLPDCSRFSPGLGSMISCGTALCPHAVFPWQLHPGRPAQWCSNVPHGLLCCFHAILWIQSLVAGYHYLNKSRCVHKNGIFIEDQLYLVISRRRCYVCLYPNITPPA